MCECLDALQCLCWSLLGWCVFGAVFLGGVFSEWVIVCVEAMFRHFSPRKCIPGARLPVSLGLHRQLISVVSGSPLLPPGHTFFHRTRFIMNVTEPHRPFTGHSVVASHHTFLGREQKWGWQASPKGPDQHAPTCVSIFVSCLLLFSIKC